MFNLAKMSILPILYLIIEEYFIIIIEMNSN